MALKRFLRVWKEIDLKDAEKHLIVAGELSAECFSCHNIGIELKTRICPHCGTRFKYMGFRRKDPLSYLQRIKDESLDIIFIDFEDFKKSLGKKDAHKLLDL